MMKAYLSHKILASRVRACISIIIGITMINDPAIAQTNLSIEEIMVTARKKEEGLQNSPVAISAFSSRDLEIRGAIDISDVAAVSPNVQFDSAASTGGLSSAPTAFIRGIGQSDFVINTDPAVGVYVDGVYVARSIGSLVDLMDVERIEVLRGPQGTLFGRNTIGGALSIISKKPSTDGVSGEVLLAAGENGYVQINGMVNLPLSDTVSLRMNATKRERDGFVKALQYHNFDLGEDDVLAFLGALRWEARDNLTIDFAADYSRNRESPAPYVPKRIGNLSDELTGISAIPSSSRFNMLRPGPVDGAPPVPLMWATQDPELCQTQEGLDNSALCHGNYWVPRSSYASNAMWTNKNGARVKPKNKVDVYGTSIKIGLDTAAGTLNSITAYRKFDASFYNDLDMTPHIIFHNNNPDFFQKQFSQELQFSGDMLDNRLDYIAGLFYFRETGSETVALVAPMLPPAFNVTTLPFFQYNIRKIENVSKAVFGQIIWHVTDRLHVTSGLRYTNDKKDITFDNRREVPSGHIIDIASGVQKANEWTHLLNIAFDIDDQTMIYGTYSEGFRDGGFPSRFPGNIPNPIPYYDPEYVKAWELGVKSKLFDNRLRLNAAIFRTDYKDMQISAAAPNLDGSTTTDNLATATIDGFELELNAVITDQFRVDASVGYLNAKIDKVAGGVLLAGGDNFVFPITTKNSLPYTPDWVFNVGLIYSLPLKSGGEILGRLDWIYKDDQYLRIENTSDMFQKSYSRINTKISYLTSDDRWEFSLGARNLTDKKYSTAGSVAVEAGASAVSISRPREIYAQMRYRFGD